jgi:GntR family transcriptional regulator
MTPAVDRTPPYLQVVNHLREKIVKGELADGDTIPSVRQIAERWGISQATAMKALAALRADGLVESVVGVGTIVRTGALHRSARDRVVRMLTTGRIYAPGEYAVITFAGLAPASPFVSETLGIEEGGPAIKRHRVTHNDAGPISASTSWFSADLADSVPALLATDRIKGGTPSAIETVTGRRAHSADDRMTVDVATAEQAAELGISEGDPVFVGRNIWRDADGEVIEVGEYAHPRGRWTHYSYQVD